jgi:hypothetical protein
MAFIAHLEQVQGEVYLLIQETSLRAEARRGFLSGHGLRTAPGGYALVKFEDGTRLELGSETIVPRLTEGAQAGKSVQLQQGIVAVTVARQPQPMVIVTPHAEAMALGTQFTLWVTGATTRLDVQEGSVKFAGGAHSFTVKAGQYAIAGADAAKTGPSYWKAPPTGLLLWLKADKDVKVTPAGVVAWVDQSGGDNNAVQPSAACRPTLVPIAVGEQPALRFDGVDDFLQLQGTFNDFRQGLSAFIVTRVASDGTSVRFLDFGQSANNIFFGQKGNATNLGFWVYVNGVTAAKVPGPGGIGPDRVQTVSVVLRAQGKATLYRNGREVGTGTTSEPSSLVRRLGVIAKSNFDPADPFFKGDIAEIVLYNRALSEAERASVEGYLQSKYFDATAPPAAWRPSNK